MKIYFAGSIRGGRNDRKIYAQIIEFLKQYGVVLTEHVGLLNNSEHYRSDACIYRTDMDLLKESDVLIAEVTIPSLGVGYEIGKAEEFNKPILCLYRKDSERKLSAMISGNNRVKLVRYEKIEEVFQVIDYFLGTVDREKR